MLACKGEVGPAREMLIDLCECFQSWRVPVWQRKCEQELEALTSSE
jgi:hypothetical protein